MVRTTIACKRCRSSKVKCVHNGIPPCRGCVKAGLTALGLCVLTGPNTRKKDINRRKNEVRKSATQDQRQEAVVLDGSPSVLPIPTSPATSLQTANLFMRKFPELAFLHKPTFSQDLRNGHDSLHHQTRMTPPRAEFLASALDVLCSPLLSSIENIQHTLHRLEGQLATIESPHIYAVQSLLVMSMFEWGQGNVYKAWMHSGAAIRMMQLLNAAVTKSPTNVVKREIYNRTLWSCFVMDRLVFSGMKQPLCFPLDAMDTHWPIGDMDFAFGNGEIQRHAIPSHFPMTMDYSYAIIVQGFEIWTKIYHWIVSGGRRKKDMQLDANLPWKETSLWMSMRTEIQNWRDAQDPRLWYPHNATSTHDSLGKGEVFGYINIIYYVSVLFLNREYIPFLPRPNATPRGPVDPPLLVARAPEGWWETRAEELFNAASCITRVLAELGEEEASLYTPFGAFCNFSAATMNIYVSCFPSMNVGRSRDGEVLVEKGLEYLELFHKMWPIGQGWWATIQRTKALYEHHSQDPGMYSGSTRDDFVGLEASIHDVTGGSPTFGEHEQDHGQDYRKNEVSLVASLQTAEEGENTGLGSAVDIEQQAIDDVGLVEPWSHEWPLWSELHSMSFNYDFETSL